MDMPPQPATQLPATAALAVARGLMDADVAALTALLTQAGMPLTVAGTYLDDARRTRELLAGGSGGLAGKLTGGVMLADSLATVLRRAGGDPDGQLPDELRGMGLVAIVRRLPAFGPRLVSLHYLRPIERDAAGHLQRRPPALLVAWDESLDALDHFWWGIAGELAERVGWSLSDFMAEHRRRSALLDERAARLTN
jgi:hypothetical protein